jgi:hypothetical protein
VHDVRWQELTKDECFGLLAERHLGRVALVDQRGPIVLPVNYLLDRYAVLFRTDDGTKLDAAVRGTRVAFEIDGVDRVEIHCDPQNTASAAVPGRLGYEHEATLRRRLAYPEIRDTMIWTMFADAYPESPCAAARLAAFDVMDTALLDALAEP